MSLNRLMKKYQKYSDESERCFSVNNNHGAIKSLTKALQVLEKVPDNDEYDIGLAKVRCTMNLAQAHSNLDDNTKALEVSGFACNLLDVLIDSRGLEPYIQDFAQARMNYIASLANLRDVEGVAERGDQLVQFLKEKSISTFDPNVTQVL